MPRYVVTLAYLSEEAMWATQTTLAELQKKVELLWGIEKAQFKYHLTSAEGHRPSEIVIATDEDFNTWMEYRERSHVDRLVAHDPFRVIQCMRTTDNVAIHRHGRLDAASLQGIAKYALNHSASNELCLCGREEEVCWGNAVKKAQAAWGVLRPVFRYIDDVSADRCVFTIVEAADFSVWVTKRMPYDPELNVFEHAAPALVAAELEKRKGRPAAISLENKSLRQRTDLVSAAGTELNATGMYDRLATTVTSVQQSSVLAVRPKFTADSLRADVEEGGFGPQFSTPTKEEIEKRRGARSKGAAHYAELQRHFEAQALLESSSPARSPPLRTPEAQKKSKNSNLTS